MISHRQDREPEALPAAGVLVEPRLLLLRGHEARGRALLPRLHARRRLSGGHARSSRARRRSARTRASRTTPPASPSRWTRSTARAIREAGAKIIWNFDYQWDGDGSQSRYYYSYWDRGEELPALLRGHREDDPADPPRRARVPRQAGRRPVPRREAQERLRHRGGRALRRARHPRDDLPLQGRRTTPTAKTKNDDTWVYVPTLRRVRRICSAQRTDAVSGTDFTFDDLRSFAGIVPQYEWKCLGEMDIIAPMNTKVAAYPYTKDHNFGPYGLSYADDRWELRHAVKIRFIPNNADHPYHHKDIYIDKQTLVAALQLRLRPQEGAVEDHLAQPPLERGQPARGQGRLVRRLGGRARAARPARASATSS